MKTAAQAAARLFILILSVLFVYYGNLYVSGQQHSGIVFDKETELDTMVYAKVLSIDHIVQDVLQPNVQEITFTARPFWGGGDNQASMTAVQKITDPDSNVVPVSVGDKVSLLAYGDQYLFQYYFRIDKIAILGAVFILFILLLGGLKGISTLLSLGLTCLSVFYVFIPAIKAGCNIYLSCTVICAFIVVVTDSIVFGINGKSLAAALSCITGVLFSGLITVVMDKSMKLTGYLNEGTYMLSSLLGIENLNVKAILFSMITIGALGAIMDMSMSVVSPLWELKENNRAISAGALVQSGLRIGRDVMGTMTNTLILAYIGSSLTVVLMYASSNYPLISLLNKEEIIFEFLQSLVGSLSILLTIPFATILSAGMLSGKHSKNYARMPSQHRRM
ncbi:MAG: YibE/F family protein [Ruminococcaceae bacterium]|nr:YibE/F family protein [Oscillospiraceae bacterium]